MSDNLKSSRSLLQDIRTRSDGQTLSLLDIFQFGGRLSDVVKTHQRKDIPVQRMAILGATTTDYLTHAITCALAQEGVLAAVHQAPFGSYVQEVIDQKSGLYSFQPGIVVLAMDWHDLVVDLAIDAPLAEVESALASKVDLLRNLWDILERRLNARIIQHTLVPPPERFRGIAERLSPASIANQIRFLNDQLLEAGIGRVHWIDIEALAYRIGTQNWSARQFYYSGRFGFDQRLLPHYLPLFRAAWRAACGHAKKVLVLDLDDTLWGGIIGDDGLDGISLGPASPKGEAFEDWQRYLKALSHRGVILAVCSKNSPEVASSGLKHSHSVLKRNDFAAFECSWNDKIQGLHRLAQSLGLGMDSFVFADDNPAECDLIRRTLPEVGVVHLGSDPAFFIERLDSGCWFDLQHYTAEDVGRASAYAARQVAVEERAQFTDIPAYLASLQMVGCLARPEERDIARIAQLEQKTNQFNLTTRRYSENAIRAFLYRNDAIVLTLRLADRFGDHGLVSTMIAVQQGDSLTIDSWTMSCRIFSRSAEQFIMCGLIDLARARGVKLVKGVYERTQKNGVVADLYTRLGFSCSPDRVFWYRPVNSATDDLTTYIRPLQGMAAL
jgi:FkbH-like protein